MRMETRVHSLFMILSGKDRTVVFLPLEISVSLREIPAQLVFFGHGFLGPEDVIAEQLGLGRDTRSNVRSGIRKVLNEY